MKTLLDSQTSLAQPTVPPKHYVLCRLLTAGELEEWERMGSEWFLPDMAEEPLFEKCLKKSLCLGLTFDLPIHIQGFPVLQYSLLFPS